jgi:hypothetical protein
MKHLVIPDTQIKKGVPLDHIRALGKFIVDKQPDKIIMIGDWADMPSLSSFDRPGSLNKEGARYCEDVEASIEAMELLLEPLKKLNKRLSKHKKKLYKPEMYLCIGNHEQRINWAIQKDPVAFSGVISIDDLEFERFGWTVVPFLNILVLDGVNYSHYFIDPNGLTGRAIGGTVHNKLTKLKTTFVMGHQQALGHAEQYTATGKRLRGLVCGAFYMHDEGYLGPQKNTQHWRGVVMLHEVEDGDFDVMEVSLRYLLKRY